MRRRPADPIGRRDGRVGCFCAASAFRAGPGAPRRRGSGREPAVRRPGQGGRRRRPGRHEAERGRDMTEAYVRVRVGSEDAHYGTIAAGAFVMQLFGDLATEVTVRRDGDEGLLRAYESVEFLAPVRPGDFLECRAKLIREGRTSRTFKAQAWKVLTTRQDVGESAADVLEERVLVARGIGTTVVQSQLQRKAGANAGKVAR